jgi:hypothetical protein
MNQLQAALAASALENATEAVQRMCSLRLVAHTLKFFYSLQHMGVLSFIPCYMNPLMGAPNLSVLLNWIALHHARATPRLDTPRIALSRHGLK